MALFVIPVASSALPSILFQISELALAFLIGQLLALSFSRSNDLESYAIMQASPLRRLVLSWQLSQAGRRPKACAVLLITALLVTITFYSTLLWSLIDVSGHVRVATTGAGIQSSGFQSSRFWGFNVNSTTTKEQLLLQILPNIGAGYRVLSAEDAFAFQPGSSKLTFTKLTSGYVNFTLGNGAYATFGLVGNTDPSFGCRATTNTSNVVVRRCSRNSTSYGEESYDWADLYRSRPVITVSPAGTSGLTGDIDLFARNTVRQLAVSYADAAEGLWAQIALDDQVITITNVYRSQTREYVDAANPAVSSTCLKVLGMTSTTSNEMIDLFKSVTGRSSIQYIHYDEQTAVITQAALSKTSNLTSTAAEDRRRHHIVYCSYSETRLSLVDSGGVLKLPKYQCEEQSQSEGVDGVETFSQCEDGGFSSPGPYAVRANVDAAFLLAQPYAFRLRPEELASPGLWELVGQSLFYVAATNIPQVYSFGAAGGTILYGKFYGYSTALMVLMVVPVALALLVAAPTLLLTRGAFSASLLETFSAYTDPAASGARVRPGNEKYRRLALVGEGGHATALAFDKTEVGPVTESGKSQDKGVDAWAAYPGR